ncbi:hypothetical protein DER29_4308 [Micromonospora sp. M71_S20]|uniref:hypothetical protein n=1 Tax=Micromonospora sp. M71_S20 TaxID=592872 RepID=UPI000EB4DCF2|nr:hypothetical protein [Micromonospora sp. M71_S20]RLK13291.1 hypothetical protein DER29_4308 [Micromonospora sp. M71_S20]
MKRPVAHRRVEPIDPDSPGGKAAAEAMSQVLAEIQVAIWRREALAAQQTEQPTPAEPLRRSA